MKPLNLLCAHCSEPSGSKLICGKCLKEVLSDKKLRKKYDRLFQERGCLLAGYICSYCGGDFSWQDPEDPSRTKRNLVCMDHTETKGSKVASRYDFSKARCACGAGGKDCHNERHRGNLKADESTEKSKERIAQKKSSPKRVTCSYFSCALLPGANGRCVLHQKSRS